MRREIAENRETTVIGEESDRPAIKCHQASRDEWNAQRQGDGWYASRTCLFLWKQSRREDDRSRMQSTQISRLAVYRQQWHIVLTSVVDWRRRVLSEHQHTHPLQYTPVSAIPELHPVHAHSQISDDCNAGADLHPKDNVFLPSACPVDRSPDPGPDPP